MLCPYLDLTFHQARQATSPADGRWAFALGFGVVFLAMLLFSLAYSGWMLDPVPALPLRVASLLGLHLLIQSILKLVLHVRALKMRRNIAVLGSGIILILAAAVLGAYCRDTPATYRGITLGEIAYRSFMAFYGLVFPAYVWICVFNKRNVNLWLAAIAIAAPMYWMGFIERRTIWLLPGVAVALLAPLIAPARQTPIAKADG
jgi:hypothetical protein